LWALQDRLSPAAVFGSYLVLSGLSRVLVELVRVNNPVLLGLTEAQLFGVASMVAGGVLIARFRTGKQRDTQASGPLPAPVA
jgi:phosphatidylglycerol:prolipoprotein diacylglycerol transferase